MFADLQQSSCSLQANRLAMPLLSHTQPPTSIQLPTDFEKLAKLALALREAIGNDAGPKGNQTALIQALRKLWDDVVCSVVENLGGFARQGS
jgi:hypothetical protein